MAKAGDGGSPTKKRRGKKPKGPFSEKRRTLTTRITEATKTRLQKAAKRGDRSVSQEIEARLDRSFIADDYLHIFFGDPETAAFAKEVQEARALIEEQMGQSVWQDIATFHAFQKAVSELLFYRQPAPSPEFEKLQADFDVATKRHLEKMLGKDQIPLSGEPPPISPLSQAGFWGIAVAKVITKSRLDDLAEALKEASEQSSEEK